MDNQNSLPQQNIATSSSLEQDFPKQPRPSQTPTNDSQIFIHPDHESGTLAVAQQAQPVTRKKKTDLVLIVLAIVIGLLVVAGSATFFIMIPRSQNVNFANSIKDTVGSSSEKTDKVNSSLEILYKAITSQAEDVTLSLSQDFRFITTKEDSFNGIFSAASNLAKQTKDNLAQKEDVKSFAVPAGDPNQEARQHRELAQDISEKAEDATELNDNLSDIVSKPVQGGSEKLKIEASKLVETTAKYIDQSTDTANYYVALSEASIELVTLGSSLYSAKDIDNAISKLTSLKNKFAEYEKSSLPERIEDYNKDIVDTFNLLLALYQDVKEGELNTEEKIAVAYTNFMNDLQSVSVRAAHDEISFWQNNEALKSFDKLSDKQTAVQKQAEQVKDANNFFLLEWAGIS